MMDRRRSQRILKKRYSLFGTLLAIVLAYVMHTAFAKQGFEQVVDKASEEAGLIVRLTAGFVRTYSTYEAQYAKGQLPTPATFRAEALAHVKKDSRASGYLSTGIVGLPGREIAQAAEDASTRNQILRMAISRDTTTLSSVIEKNGITTHRSLWAFKASDQACADCHNEIQNLTGSDKWQVGDLMGAQIVEQDIERPLHQAGNMALMLSSLLFIAVLAAWFCFFYLLNHFRLAKELKLLATTDPLTGCINRREVQERINDMEGRINGALLMLDLDKFKDINDTYGHDAGDEVIRDFTKRIKAALRSDDWVARFGGEEFLVWLPEIKPVDAIRLAERLREEAENAEVALPDSTVRYTVSIGLNIVQNAMPSRFENWIKVADNLLYRAKMDGRNRIACDIGVPS